MMKKTKKLLVVSLLSCAAIGSIAGITNTSGSRRVFGAAGGEWVHYARVEATRTTKGNREYWVQCGGSYQFTAPAGVTPREGGALDYNQFGADDDRLITPVALAASDIDMNVAGDKALSLGSYADATVNSITLSGTDVGTNPAALDLTAFAEKTTHGVKEAKASVVKDGKEYALFSDVTICTALIYNNPDSLKLICPKISGDENHNIYGYYKLAQRNDTYDTAMTDGTKILDKCEAYVSGANGSSTSYCFKGTLDGNGYIFQFQSAGGNNGFFTNLDGATIKNIQIEDKWYKNTNDYSLFAASILNCKFENVTFKALANLTIANFDPATASPTGWLCPVRHMSSSWKNCNFNVQTANVSTLFNTQNGNDCTFTNCTFTCGSYYRLGVHWKLGTLLTATGLTINGTCLTAA